MIGPGTYGEGVKTSPAALRSLAEFLAFLEGGGMLAASHGQEKGFASDSEGTLMLEDGWGVRIWFFEFSPNFWAIELEDLAQSGDKMSGPHNSGNPIFEDSIGFAAYWLDTEER
jgi:hypothetical protein